MKRIIITLCLLLVACAPAQADEWFTWDETNTALHVPLTLAFLADYRQTLEIANGCVPDENGAYAYHENNYALGTCPSHGEVQEYFVLSYLLTSAITYALPSKWSHGFQTGVITMEVIAVSGNYQLGIGVKF
jgi:hypothetical protein